MSVKKKEDSKRRKKPTPPFFFYWKQESKIMQETQGNSSKTVQTMHLLLQCKFGELYTADVREFQLQRLTNPPLQHETNWYDCGMFVIKYMQGVQMLHGVQKFDELERFRLLLDLVKDTSSVCNEVMDRFDQCKERYMKLRKTKKKKLVGDL